MPEPGYKVIHVLLCKQTAIHAVLDDFPHSGSINSYDRNAGCHGLDQDQPLCFALGRKNKHIHCMIGIDQVFSLEYARQCRRSATPSLAMISLMASSDGPEPAIRKCAWGDCLRKPATAFVRNSRFFSGDNRPICPTTKASSGIFCFLRKAFPAPRVNSSV
jgi:hypothetical protein